MRNTNIVIHSTHKCMRHSDKDDITKSALYEESSNYGSDTLAAAVRASVRKFAADKNVSAVGFDPLVVQFALGN